MIISFNSLMFYRFSINVTGQAFSESLSLYFLKKHILSSEQFSYSKAFEVRFRQILKDQSSFFVHKDEIYLLPIPFPNFTTRRQHRRTAKRMGETVAPWSCNSPTAYSFRIVSTEQFTKVIYKQILLMDMSVVLSRNILHSNATARYRSFINLSTGQGVVATVILYTLLHIVFLSHSHSLFSSIFCLSLS
jgi:hypothetical protein